MAVLPTPASPTNKGLFLRRRQSVWMVRSISASLPIKGSIRPFKASSLRLVAYLSSGLPETSPSASGVPDERLFEESFSGSILDIP